MIRGPLALSLAGLLAGAYLTGCGGDEPPPVTSRPAPPTAATQPSPPPAGGPPASAPSEAGAAATQPGARLTPEQAANILPFLVTADCDSDEGPAPLTVRCKSELMGGVAPYKVTWNFGDGSPEVNDRNPTHTFAKPGAYRIDLIARDGQNDVDTDYFVVEVK